MKKIFILLICFFQAFLVFSIEPPIFDLEYAKKMQVGVGFNAKGEKPKVKASMKGKVVVVNNDPENPSNIGKFVIIEHNKAGTVFYSIYAMLGETTVLEGFNVYPGAVIGYAGPTGPIQEIEVGANLLFGFFSEEQNDLLSTTWNEPIYAYKKYWYNPSLVIKNKLEN